MLRGKHSTLIYKADFLEKLTVFLSHLSFWTLFMSLTFNKTKQVYFPTDIHSEDTSVVWAFLWYAVSLGSSLISEPFLRPIHLLSKCVERIVKSTDTINVVFRYNQMFKFVAYAGPTWVYRVMMTIWWNQERPVSTYLSTVISVSKIFY